MDEQQKKQLLIGVLAFCWAFMLWWWFISNGGIGGSIVSLLVASVVGGIAWFVTGLLS
jgi:hypothetical protein